MTARAVPATLSIAEATALATDILMRAGASEPNAAVTAAALVDAECIGNPSHGLARLPGYAGHLRTGKVDGHATPVFDWAGTALLRADVQGGLAYPAIHAGLARAAARARETGVVVLAVRNSHHGGAIGLYLERLATDGLAALAFSNTPAAIPAWGGRAPVYGTNPIAFAAPRPDGPPLVIDGATAQVARGKLMVAAQRGEPVPDGWGFDAEGKPSNDPEEILHRGAMGAIGGAKGAAFALMIDMLCGPLTGSGLSVEATPFEDHDGPPPRLGQFFMVINPALSGGETALHRIEALAGHVTASEGARLPGGGRAARRAAAEASGIALNPDLQARLSAL